MSEENEYGDFGEDEMGDFQDDYELLRNIAEQNCDDELISQLDEIDAQCAMVVEGKLADAVRNIREARGETGVMELVFAIERALGWHFEITGTKADFEDYLFSKHGIYDARAWLKVRNSRAWAEMTLDVTYSALRRRKDMVAEAFGLPVDKNREAIRRFLHRTWKIIDMRLA
jgi:hypothetical protein